MELLITPPWRIKTLRCADCFGSIAEQLIALAKRWLTPVSSMFWRNVGHAPQSVPGEAIQSVEVRAEPQDAPAKLMTLMLLCWR